MPYVLAALRQLRDPPTCEACTWILARSATPGEIAAAFDEDGGNPYYRTGLARALGAMEAPGALPVLGRILLESGDWQARAAAAIVLGAKGEEDAPFVASKIRESLASLAGAAQKP